MKHLLTAFACCFAMAGSAQFIPQQMGYNPDVNGDELIGVDDLMGTLSLYGSSFESDDSLTVVSYTFPDEYPIPLTPKEIANGAYAQVEIDETVDFLYVHQTEDRQTHFWLPQGEGFKVLQLFLSLEGFNNWPIRVFLTESPNSDMTGSEIYLYENNPVTLTLIRGHNGVWYQYGVSP